jgi:hypothetical protein
VSELDNTPPDIPEPSATTEAGSRRELGGDPSRDLLPEVRPFEDAALDVPAGHPIDSDPALDVPAGHPTDSDPALDVPAGYPTDSQLQATYETAVQRWQAELAPQTPEGQAILDEARGLGVQTPPDGAVLWSGPGQQELATDFASANDRMTLEQTDGGKWLANSEQKDALSALGEDEASRVWAGLSKDFVEQASGTIVDFTDSAQPGRVFQRVELQSVLDNPKVDDLDDRHGGRHG